MPDSSSPIIVVLLASIVGLLAVIAGLLAGILRRLGRNGPAVLADRASPAVETGGGSGGDIPAESAFESFLSEDPSRRQLSKKEQFAAYRSWRKTKGLNWSASAGS